MGLFGILNKISGYTEENMIKCFDQLLTPLASQALCSIGVSLKTKTLFSSKAIASGFAARAGRVQSPAGLPPQRGARRMHRPVWPQPCVGGDIVIFSEAGTGILRGSIHARSCMLCRRRG